MLAVSHRDVSLASPLWDYNLCRALNRWRTFTHKEFAVAMSRCRAFDSQTENMDADNPDLTKAQGLSKKILVYHGLADTGIPPQSTVRHYERTITISGGLSKSQEFHRLFLVPGIGHCVRYKGCADNAEPPTEATEDIFETLREWVECNQTP